MHRIILSLIFLVAFGFAKSDSEIFEVLANNVETKGDVVIASGDVVLFSKSYYLSAQKVIYDRSKETFELFDDVTVIKDNQAIAKSHYAFLSLKEEGLVQNPLFLVDSDTSLWFNSQNADKKASKVSLKQSSLSGCDCDDPDWRIEFSEGNYDTEKQWVDTYNARLYIKDVPVFYTPYFGLPTDRSRHTGLLIPSLGYSNSEGFQYTQPIFLALDPSYDLELTPEIRTNRGYGLYTNFRWADSQYSMLDVKVGGFKDRKSYQNEKNLKNQKHYGYNIDYHRSKLFSSGDDKDGLLLSVNWLNDIDYKNLTETQNFVETENKIKSFMNYYYDRSNFYTGLYFKYYLDTLTNSNDATLQELPQLHLHKYYNEFLVDNLSYSSDFKTTYYTRDEGLNALRYDFSLPISYSFSMFDDYLNIVLKNELTVTKLNYMNQNVTNFENGTFMQNEVSVEAFTELIKPYEGFIHSMNLSSKISIPNSFKKDGDLYSINTQNNSLESFEVTEDKKRVTFSLNQYFFDSENLKEIVKHKISQSIIYEDDNSSDLGDLENELIVNYLLGQVSNRLVYSNQDDDLIESSSNFSLNYLDYFLKLNYYMSKNTPNSNRKDLESYAIEAGLKFLDDYSFKYIENYNIEEDTRSKQGFVFSVDDRCWNVELSFIKEIEPSTTTSATPIKQDIVYLKLTLKPFGTFQVK